MGIIDVAERKSLCIGSVGVVMRMLLFSVSVKVLLEVVVGPNGSV